MRITDHDRKMTAIRAEEICGMWASNPDGVAHRFADAEAVLFAGGSIYRQTMWEASAAWFWPEKVTEAGGGGIGCQRAGLSAWMTAQFPDADAPGPPVTQ